MIWLRDSLPGIPFAGAFLAIIPLALASIAVLTMLRLPKSGQKDADSKPVRPLTEIIGTQRFITGMLCGIGSLRADDLHDDGAPLAMVVGCGYSPEGSTTLASSGSAGDVRPRAFSGPPDHPLGRREGRCQPVLSS